MVNGKPYISAKSATIKPENAPRERQSRVVRGRVKLKAKMMKTKELITTSGQSPYAGASFIFHLPWDYAYGFPRAHHVRRASASATAGRQAAEDKAEHRRG